MNRRQSGKSAGFGRHEVRMGSASRGGDRNIELLHAVRWQEPLISEQRTAYAPRCGCIAVVTSSPRAFRTKSTPRCRRCRRAKSTS